MFGYTEDVRFVKHRSSLTRSLPEVYSYHIIKYSAPCLEKHFQQGIELSTREIAHLTTSTMRGHQILRVHARVSAPCSTGISLIKHPLRSALSLDIRPSMVESMHPVSVTSGLNWNRLSTCTPVREAITLTRETLKANNSSAGVLVLYENKTYVFMPNRRPCEVDQGTIEAP